MRLIWEVELQDVEQVRSFFQAYEADPLVRERQQRNLAQVKPLLSKESVWEILVACLLTTQQRSGPSSAISRFIEERPFLLNYDDCLSQTDLAAWANRILSGFGGIRRHSIIAGEVSANLADLEKGLWKELMGVLDGLRALDDPAAEREAADFIRAHLKGFGPKQSRNLLQWLGLTRYEIPIDSRISKWLNRFGFPLQLSASALSDPGYYDLVSDGFQQLCKQSDLFPCLLDAAIFVSFD
jgi:hypothetical protein